ncbi:MAG: hypothetical protein HFI05_13720 [Lachnospiraceae bacterium]|jgi:hypothetical protein|nr:hypothetical protein [Lachnospiraceae bacterium]
MIKLLEFFGLIGGSFLLLNLKPTEFFYEISAFFQKEEKNIPIKKRIENLNKKKKEKAFFSLIEEVKEILEYIDQRELFARICVAAGLFALLGTILSFSMDNLFMIFPLSIGLALIPFLYMKFSGIRLKKTINEELETALSIITTSYLRSEDVIQSIKENIEYMKMPCIRKPFQNFLAQTIFVNPNIPAALENLKAQIESDVFKEWVDELKACQIDKNLKVTLTPIIEKFSDMRIISSEIEELLYAPVKEFITMCMLLIAIVPGLYFINRDWFFALVSSGLGKIVLSITVFVIVLSISGVIKASKPIEYKR